MYVCVCVLRIKSYLNVLAVNKFIFYILEVLRERDCVEEAHSLSVRLLRIMQSRRAWGREALLDVRGAMEEIKHAARRKIEFSAT